MKRVAIHSVPRSGSTWLGQVLNSSPRVAYRFQPLFSYAFKGRLSTESTGPEIVNFFESISLSDDDFINQKDEIQKGICPQFEKTFPPTHVIYKEVRYHHVIENMMHQDRECKVIGLIRDPRAVLASWIRAPKEFKEDWDIENEWRFAEAKNQGKVEEFYGFEKWIEVAELFEALQRIYPERFLIVQYAHLLNSPLKSTKQIFEFCELDFDSSTNKFLELSSSRNDLDAYSVFKRKKEDISWRDVLPEHIAEAVAEEISSSEVGKYLQHSASS